MAVSSIPFSVVADLDLVRCLLLAVWTVNDCLFNRWIFAAAPAVVVVVVMVMWHLRLCLRCQHLRHHGSTSHEVCFQTLVTTLLDRCDETSFILFLDLVRLKCAFAWLISSLWGRTIIRPNGREEVPKKLFGPFSGQWQSPVSKKHPWTSKMGHTWAHQMLLKVVEETSVATKCYGKGLPVLAGLMMRRQSRL